jgi:penicillin amidase
LNLPEAWEYLGKPKFRDSAFGDGCMEQRPSPINSALMLLSWLIIVMVCFGEVLAEDGEERLEVQGLESPVEIRVDRWGVAHITAQSEDDLFFAQGYHAAKQRLFQFELWRRQATGTVSEILGRRELERDIGARLIKYRGNIQKEFGHYHPRGEAIITAFTKGINAWIDRTRNEPDLLPVEFRMLGIEPGHWTPEVVISRHQGLVHNLTEEWNLARAVALIGPEKVKELVWFHPGVPELTLDESLPKDLFTAEVLTRYNAARSPLQFKPEDVRPEYRAEAKPPATEQSAISEGIDWRDIGSNNWVVKGHLTESGFPVLANDPHRVLNVPSLRYFVHLTAPGWNVIGGGEPTLPGISIGHNEHGAWGLTVFRIDAEDLYIYRTDPDDPNKYRYQDSWEPMRIVEETIPLKGEEPAKVQLKFTAHGPVIYEDPKNQIACALRSGWLEAGGAPYLASLRMNQAKTWEEFREACRYSHLPGENMVWADTKGNIGWQAVGISPIRKNWSGLVPVPGDGRYEWDGYLPIGELPHVVNPPQGFWNTSNESLVPKDYPHRAMVGWTWADPYRGARVREVLASGRKLNLMDQMRLQQDELSIPARTLVPLLRDLPLTSDTLLEARKRLLSWDDVLDRDSVEAGIYVAWERRIAANLEQRFVPETVRKFLAPLSMKRMIDWLLSPDGRFGDDPMAGRDQLLIESFTEAVKELEDRLGKDLDNWHYGQEKYKHAKLRHPLSAAVNAEWQAKLDIGPLPRGGNSYTVNNTGGANNQPSGGTFRVIIDTGNWDAALATNSPGQGGDPEGPHYDDLFAPWAKGRYFPLFYSPAKIDSVTGKTLHLLPTSDGTASTR